MWRSDLRSAFPLAALLLASCAGVQGGSSLALPAIDVPASRETAPVGTSRADAADDPAIWRNAADPAASLILGTDKKAGLYVYGLDGEVRDFVPAGWLNNVDLREIPTRGGAPMVLVGASDRSDGAVPRIALFRLDGAAAKLEPLGSQVFLPDGRTVPAEAYGFCMGPGRAPGELARAYVVLKDGEIAESRLVAQDASIRPEYLRSFKLASQPEGCVVDEDAGSLYVGEEVVGIWRFALGEAQPQAEAFASVGAADGLVADVEGLAIARGDDGRRLLVASSQGDNAYALFDLETGALFGRFRIDGGAIDGTSETDGIEIDARGFGPAFPGGLFVAQDGDNRPEAQNFKLVSWQQVLQALSTAGR